MRILDIPRDDRYRNVQLHLRRDKPSSYARRRARHSYPVVMQRGRGTDGPTPEQLEFAKWVKDVVDAYGDPPRKWSLSRLSRESGVHRNNIYEWMNAKAYPQAETVKRFCDNLGLDPAEPARILGWHDGAPTAPRDLEGFIRRARALADHPKTSEERRRVLEARIAAAEATLRAAKEMEKSAESLLREALEDPEDLADR
jgi:transcriptional regulator with XRE-family HTH domain